MSFIGAVHKLAPDDASSHIQTYEHAELSAPMHRCAFLGICLGVLSVVGPDHLCTLVSLTVRGKRTLPAAVATGVSWSVGHAVGMVMICLLAGLLQTEVNIDKWARYGDFLAGAVMAALGLCLLIFEQKFLELRSDGDYDIKCCNGHGVHDHSDCHVIDHADPEHNPDECSICTGVDDEQQPLLRPQTEIHRQRVLADFWGAAVGMMQGMCCPSCLLGVIFAGQFGEGIHPCFSRVATFVICLVMSSCISTSLVLCGLVHLGNLAGDKLEINVKTVYRWCCAFTMSMGITWILLAYLGKVHILEASESVLDLHRSH